MRLQTDNPEQAYEFAYYVLNHFAATQEARDIANQVILEAEVKIDPFLARAIREKSLHQSLETIGAMLVSQAAQKIGRAIILLPPHG